MPLQTPSSPINPPPVDAFPRKRGSRAESRELVRQEILEPGHFKLVVRLLLRALATMHPLREYLPLGTPRRRRSAW